MGDLFRRFWVPAMLSSELTEQGGAPVKVPLLGESLIAFRGQDGRVGLLESRCPHRHANLYWGRNEEDGLRCVYHGWKFGFDGQCLEMPAEPVDSDYKTRVKAVAYPTVEAAGIVWAYLGPEDLRPEFPHFEFSDLPADRVHASKRLQRCNYFQNVEGELDTAHVQFLHRVFKGDTGRKGLEHVVEANPEYTIAETPVGMLAIAERHLPDGDKYWRITPFIMPSFTMVPSGPSEFQTFTAAVPIDDESMWGFTITWQPDRAFNAVEVDNVFSGNFLHVHVDPKTFVPLANLDNDYLIDRSMQKSENYTGIVGIRNQDLPVQEDQDGRICRREDEHLGTTDRAIVAARRLLLRTAKGLAKGVEPAQPTKASSFRMRSLAQKAPAERGWSELFDEAQPHPVGADA